MVLPLHEVSPIETPEQIEVHLPLAGIGSRAQAFLVDLLWQTLPIIVAVVALQALFPGHTSPIEQHDDGTFGFDGVFQAVVSLGVFLINFGYFAFFETIWQGQTPGKRSAGLRVVKDTGHPLDGRAALLRNFLRVVDYLPGGYVLGIALIFIGRQGKRAGDYAAGTVVIRDQLATRLPALRVEAPSPLSADDRAMLAAFIARRAGLEAGPRDRVAYTMAQRLAPAVGKAVPTERDADAFLVDLDQALHGGMGANPPRP